MSNDIISIGEAFNEPDRWKRDPDKMIFVQMTHEDLRVIVELAEEKKRENQNERRSDECSDV